MISKRVGLMALALAGCSVTTETLPLDSRTAIIKARGSDLHDASDVGHAALVEAARQTLAAGYTHFQIVDTQARERSGFIPFPGQSTTTGTATATCYGNTCNAYGTSTTTSTPGALVPYVMPGADFTVRFLNWSDIYEGIGLVFDAKEILAAQK